MRPSGGGFLEQDWAAVVYTAFAAVAPFIYPGISPGQIEFLPRLLDADRQKKCCFFKW